MGYLTESQGVVAEFWAEKGKDVESKVHKEVYLVLGGRLEV